MSGDPYNLRIGIRPEEQDNPLLAPYISVFATTYTALSSSMHMLGTGMPQWWTQEEVDAIQESNARARQSLAKHP